MKTKKSIEMVGMIATFNGLKKATPQDCQNVVEFHKELDGRTVVVSMADMMVGVNGTAIALLEKHPTLNIWTGVSKKGNKIHFSRKKMVATLIVWY